MPGTSASAVPVFNLELNNGFQAPFAAENIRPGDRGSKSVILRNIGNVDGQIAIWISNVEESDLVGDGAHLDDYLYFEVNCAELSTDVRMPCLIDCLPTAPLGGSYIWLLNVRAGQMVQIDWFWEFLENYHSQNEAQGDSLSFDINYLLGEMPPPNLNTSWLEIQVFDQLTMALLDVQGRSVDTTVATDTSRSASLTISEGASCLSEDGRTVRRIVLSEEKANAPVGAGQALVSPVISISAFVSAEEKVRTFVDQAILRINYDPNLLPSLTESVGLYMHVERNSWAPLPMTTENPPQIGQCGGMINCSGDVGVIATFDPYNAAYFLPSGMIIDASKQDFWNPIIFVSRVGGVVKVTVTVTNVGQVPGEQNVTLTVNGQDIGVKQVVLGPMESKEVTFDLTGLDQGDYEIEVSGLSDHVVVGTQVNWWLIFFVSCLPIAVLVAYVYSSRRWKEMQGRVDMLQNNMAEVESKLAESEIALMMIDERQDPEVSRPRQGGNTAPSALPTTIPTQTVEDSLAAYVASSEPVSSNKDNSYWVADSFNQVDSVVKPYSAESIGPPVVPIPSSKLKNASLEDAISIEDSIQFEEEVGNHQLKVAKEYIMAKIQSEGQLVIEEVPNNQNGLVAMAALSQLVDEGKVRIIQEKRRTVYLMK